MGNSYHVYEATGIAIVLDEMSCKFQLDIQLPTFDNGWSVTPTLEISEVIDIAVNLLGPLHWFHEKPEEIVPEFISRLRKRGFV